MTNLIEKVAGITGCNSGIGNTRANALKITATMKGATAAMTRILTKLRKVFVGYNE